MHGQNDGLKRGTCYIPIYTSIYINSGFNYNIYYKLGEPQLYNSHVYVNYTLVGFEV
jgi:hypothetical protein